MAERLRSILRPTHWSLLIKSVVFALAWFSLPFWAFAFVAAYLFFFPWFQTAKFLIPFGALLVAAYSYSAPHLWVGVLLFTAFYLLLGIKELIFVQRHIPYHIATLFILFLTSVQLFTWLNTPNASFSSIYSLAVVALFFLMAKTLFDYLGSDAEEGERLPLTATPLASVTSFLAWQMLWVITFLPIGILYQAAAFFLIMSTLLEFAASYYSRELDKQRILAVSGAFAFLLIVTLSSAPWIL